MAAENGTFFILHNHAGHYSHLALDVPGGNPNDGVLIQQFHFHGGPNQQWRFQTTPAHRGPELFRPEFHRILNQATGMALDVPNGSVASRERIQQFPPHNGWNQTWILRRV